MHHAGLIRPRILLGVASALHQDTELQMDCDHTHQQRHLRCIERAVINVPTYHDRHWPDKCFTAHTEPVPGNKHTAPDKYPSQP